MNKHTPGPWHWHRSRTMQHLQDESGNCFAQVSMPIIDAHEYEANARLIAAAPDLYRLLQEAKRLMDIAWDRCDGDLFGKEHNNAVDWGIEVEQLLKRVQP